MYYRACTGVCANVAKSRPTYEYPTTHAQTTKFKSSAGMAGISCEPGRKKAYSKDLRWRMVWQREVLGFKYHQIASNLNVHPSTVCRVAKLFDRSGSVDHKPYLRDKQFQSLTPVVELVLLHIVLQKPGIYLHEIKKELAEATGVDVSASAICRCLKRVGYSRQRMKLVAIQRDDGLRAQFVSDVSLYEPEMLIFIDETGSDKRDSLRKYGYSMRGRPAKSHKIISRGKHVSAIAMMSMNGILDVDIVHGSVNGEVFCDFVEKFLVPHLLPYNGHNPHSVIILDNCSIHYCQDALHMIQEVGALVHFLPPYSPDYNPIEEAFSKLKSSMKTMEQEAQVMDIDTVILSAFTTITPSDCIGWINDSEIYY